MKDRAGGHAEYGFTAEFYDHVAPCRKQICCVTHPAGRQERPVHAFPRNFKCKLERRHPFDKLRAGSSTTHGESAAVLRSEPALSAAKGCSRNAYIWNCCKSPYGAQYPGELIFVARGD